VKACSVLERAFFFTKMNGPVISITALPLIFCEVIHRTVTTIGEA
jgi:hypothetical protein